MLSTNQIAGTFKLQYHKKLKNAPDFLHAVLIFSMDVDVHGKFVLIL